MNSKTSRRSRSKQLRPRVSSNLGELRQIDERLLSTQRSMLPNTKDSLVPRLRKNKVYTFSQTIATAIAGSSSIETDGALTYSLSVVPNTSSWQAIFDSYRIVGVRVSFIPQDANPNAAPIYTVLDYDDNTAITQATMLAYDTLQVSPASVYFERSFIPKVAIATYQAGTFAGYSQPNLPQWIDCANPGVQHYGLKYAVPAMASAGLWTAISEILIQFKNTR
jgi:hypothetical protein